MRVDLVADVALAAEVEHVLAARALGDRDRRSEVGAIAVLVSDVLDEQHEQHVVLVLAASMPPRSSSHDAQSDE